jgi:hypothetical protein
MRARAGSSGVPMHLKYEANSNSSKTTWSQFACRAGKTLGASVRTRLVS